MLTILKMRLKMKSNLINKILNLAIKTILGCVLLLLLIGFITQIGYCYKNIKPEPTIGKICIIETSYVRCFPLYKVLWRNNNTIAVRIKDVYEDTFTIRNIVINGSWYIEYKGITKGK